MDSNKRLKIRRFHYALIELIRFIDIENSDQIHLSFELFLGLIYKQIYSLNFWSFGTKYIPYNKTSNSTNITSM